MSSICIIPARGGSKRIHKKNIKFFCGKPIIAYSIEAAKKSELFDRIIVSTDDEEIAQVSISYGAEVPFFRSSENSSDFAGIVEVLLEVLEKLSTVGERYSTVCCILPTAPFVSSMLLKEAKKKLEKSDFNCVFPVVEYSYPIQRSLLLENDYLQMRWPENFPKRSQDLQPSYHDSGQFYFIYTDTLNEEKKLFTSRAGGIILNNLQVQDIDTVVDWDLAKLKYKLLNS